MLASVIGVRVRQDNEHALRVLFNRFTFQVKKTGVLIVFAVCLFVSIYKKKKKNNNNNNNFLRQRKKWKIFHFLALAFVLAFAFHTCEPGQRKRKMASSCDEKLAESVRKYPVL